MLKDMLGFFLTLSFGVVFLNAATIEKLSIDHTVEMDRADCHYATFSKVPRAVLVLCPGTNESGVEMMEEVEWRKFADDNELGLLSISFASDLAVLALGEGYPMAADGSGAVLLKAIKTAFGSDLPLVIYGFSAGALFAAEFADWAPDRVVAWSGYAAGEGGVPKSRAKGPPGLLICGEYDAARYSSMLAYFKRGRAMGRPWLWLSLPKTDHVFSPESEVFVRSFLSAILRGGGGESQWVDIDRESALSEEDAVKQPFQTGYLPDVKLLSEWQRLHEP